MQKAAPVRKKHRALPMIAAALVAATNFDDTNEYGVSSG
jgi:hypothetical protein